jgi:uncharacterized DUF497 family protein
MKQVNWDPDKNAWLISERGVSFDDVLFCLENEDILDDIAHPNQDKYQGQKMLIIAIDNYAYLVPYIENEHEIFLKTIIPNRKATKKYLGI